MTAFKALLPTLTRRKFGEFVGVSCAALFASRSNLTHARTPDIEAAVQIGSGVAANPADRAVLEWHKHILVVTESGTVWAHEITGATPRIRAPYLLRGTLQHFDGDVRFVFSDGTRGLFVIRTDGTAVLHRILSANSAPVELGPAELVYCPTPIAANAEDQRILLLGWRLLVFRTDGFVGFHEIYDTGTTWSAGQLFGSSSYWPVASLPVDRWIVRVCRRDIGVVTSAGDVFSHAVDVVENVIEAPRPLSLAQPVASHEVDRWVIGFPGELIVITATGDVWSHPAGCNIPG